MEWLVIAVIIYLVVGLIITGVCLKDERPESKKEIMRMLISGITLGPVVFLLVPVLARRVARYLSP